MMEKEGMENIRTLMAENLETMQRFRSSEKDEKENPNINIESFSNSGETRDLVAIDGSYSFILNLSSMWLAIVRVGAMHYRFSETEGYQLIDHRASEKPVLVSTKKDIMKKMGENYEKLFESTIYASEQQREMVNQLRRLEEEKMALFFARSKSNIIITMDGTLTPIKDTGILKDAQKECERNNNILLGVSKDSFTHSFRSYKTDEEVLFGLDHRDLGYVLAPMKKMYRKESLLYDGMLGDVYFSKLHPKAPKWFRIDLGTFKDRPKEVFSQLANYSKSALCPGYVYPLLEAHRYVVTVRHFHSLYEDIVLNLAGELDISMDEAVNALTHLEGTRKGAFHEYLDLVSREV